MHSASRAGHLVAGRYRLLSQLGRGAMGIVWHGRDELLDRDVAVKQIVLAPMASQADARESFGRTIREARTAARLSHPGVVTVFDVVEEGGMPWIVMELIQARPLDQVIAEDGPLTPAQAAQLGLRLLDALSTAHAAGVLHRDVKPSNVLICPDGKAILSDFGIATIQGDPAMTQAGMVAGTPGFTPPERVRGAEATPASDLWSLGATLYAAVEGRGPFDRAGGSAAIVASIATEPAPRAPSAGPLAPVIDMLLRTDPEQRPDAAATARMLTAAWTTSRRSDRLTGPPAGWRAGSLAGPPAAAPLAGSAAPLASAGPVPLASAGSVPDSEPAAGLLAAAAGLDATTATQIVTVTGPEATDGQRSGAAGLAAAVKADPPSAVDAITARVRPAGGSGADSAGNPPSPDNPDSSSQPGALAATSVVPDLMATPVFAELRMPAPAAPRSEGAANASQDADISPAGLPGCQPGAASRAAGSPGWPAASWRSLRNGIDSLVHSRRGLVLTAPIAVSALVVGIVFVAFPGFRSLISHLPASSAIGSGPGRGAQLSSKPGAGGHRAGGSSGSQGRSGTPAPAGSHGAAGQPTPNGPSGGPSSPGRPSPTGSPSTSPTPSPSPSPSQTSPKSAGGTLPAGYAWKSESAQSVGTTAGFRLAAPAAWLITPGLQTYIGPALGSARLGIDMAPFAVQAPVREARRLQAAAITHHRYRGYHLVSIVGITFHGWPAASWTFWWKPLTSPRTDVTAIIFTAQTSAGPQPYILSMAAPAAHAASASHVLRIALRTFTPLP